MSKRLNKDEMRELFMKNSETLVFDEKWQSKVDLSGDLKKHITVDYGKRDTELLEKIVSDIEQEVLDALNNPTHEQTLAHEARHYVIDNANESVEWEYNPFVIPLDKLGMTKEEKDLYLNGEWKMEPVDLIVLYTKGDRKSKQDRYGKDNVHYVNTKRSDVRDVIMGHRYEHIIVDDEGVSQEDIDLVKKYLVD